MRVLHLIYDHPDNPWVGGGGAVRAHEVNRRLALRGDRVRTVCGAFPGAPPSGTWDGVRYEFIGASRPYPWSRLRYARRAGRLLREPSYDVAVVDVSAYTPLPVPRRPAAAVVGVVHQLTGPRARARWGRLAGGWLARDELRRIARIGRVSVVSEHTRRTLLERLPGLDIRVIGNAVDGSLFRVRRRETEPPYLLFLGRLDILHKGIDVLIEAFGRLAAEHPDLRLRIAGSGRDAQRVARLAASSPASGRIELLGLRRGAHKAALLAGARVVAMPSRMEPWGMVAAEAMAAAAPLVASRVDGLPEVTGEEGAVLVPPGDAEMLAAALSNLLGDGPGREALGRRARERASRHFRWDAIADAHRRFLQDSLH